MVCRCTKCNKDFFVSDNTLYLQTGLCVHCRNLALTPPTQPTPVTTKPQQSVTPKPQPKVRLSTILLLITMMIVIFVVYVLPEITNYEKPYVTDYNHIIEVTEKDDSIVYTPNLPYANLVVENGIVVGYDVKIPYVSSPQQVIVPNGVTEIADNAFEGFYGLVGITFNDSLERVGKYAFLDCYNLQYVDTNDSLVTIDDFAFTGLEITEIVLPNSLDYLGVSALNKVSLTDVTLPENTRLGSNCLDFQYITGNSDDEVVLNNLYIKAPSNDSITTNFVVPDGITSIEDNAFYSRIIESIEIPEGVVYIAPRAFMLCENLTEVTFPSSLVAVDEFAFYNCSKLDRVEFNVGLKVIGYNAFVGCGNGEVEIPDSVKVVETPF